MQDEISWLIKVEQTEEVEQLAGLNYTPEEIAMYLEIPRDLFMKEFNDKESKIRFHFERGILVARAKVDIETLESAKNGNITAAQRLDKIQQRNQFEFLKQQMINGES